MSVPMLAVKQDRIWGRLMALAEIGRTGTTGVDRQALTSDDLAAKGWLLDWARARGHAVATDGIGNLFVRREGAAPDAPAVMVGSHLDTEPTGGRFDGAYGVVAGMELLDALDEAGIVTARPVELVAWTNEEGCRFQPGCMGSRAFAAPALLPAFLAERDADGTSVSEALARHDAALADLPRRALGRPFAAYLEAHIEQGPVLEEEAAAVAAVSGIQGRRVFEITVDGRTGHAGTVPYALRRDALERAAAILADLYARAAAEPDIRITPGRLVLEPNSPSVVPGRVRLTVDIRHPDEEVLAAIPGWLASIAGERRGVEVAVTAIDCMAPAAFAADLVAVARAASAEMGGLGRALVSGATHDAHPLAAFCPTAMVFVRCRGGISHDEDEYASPEDLAAGAAVLSACFLHAIASAADLHAR